MLKLSSLNKKSVLLTTLLIFMLFLFIIGIINIYTHTKENQIKLNDLLQNEKKMLDSERSIITYRIGSVIGDLLFLSADYELNMDENRPKNEIAREWQLFADNKSRYDQIRFIDQNGNEQIKINYSEDGSFIADDPLLQNKKDRYYFGETAELGKGEVYISKFDLNIEKDQIEKPDKTIIRFGTPLFDSNNEFKGIIILNYYGKELMGIMDELSANSQSSKFLLNSDGYSIYNNLDKSQDSSFIYNEKENMSFKNQFPDEWNNMQSSESGEFKTDQGYFIYKKIIQTPNETIESGLWKEKNVLGDENWTMVSFIPSQGELAYLINPSFKEYFYYITDMQLVFFVLLFILSLVIALLFQFNREAKAKVRKNRDYMLKFASQLPGMLYQCEITPEGKVSLTFSSAQIKDMFGFTPEEVRDDFSLIRQVIHPDDLELMHANISESAANLTSFQFEYRVLLPGQPVHWILANSMPEKLDDGTIVLYGYNTDITSRKEMENALNKEKELLNIVLESIEDCIVMTKLSGEIILVNAATEQITGYSMGEVVNRDVNDIFHLAHARTGENKHKYIMDMLQKGDNFNSVTDFVLMTKDGTEKRISLNIAITKATEGEEKYIISSFHDVSKEYELEKQIEGFLDVNIDMLCVTDVDGKFHKVNKKFQEILGYRPDEVEGEIFLNFVHPDDIDSTISAMDNLSNNNTVMGFTNRYRCKDGSYKYIEWFSEPGVGRYIYSSARDVTSQRQREDELWKISTRDKLTMVYNRYYFESTIHDQMEYSERYGEPLSMLLLDLDHFKQVNDTWGHQVGDELLVLTAQTVSKAIRESDILFRVGGEEFVVLLPRTPIKGAYNVAEKIREAIENNPLDTVGIRTVSIGAAQRMKAESFRHWYRRLDEALYRAKETGRNRVVVSDGNEELPIHALNLEWKSEWTSGNNEIDEQHKDLIQIGNVLINLSLEGTNQKEIMKQLEILMDHTVKHFAAEEKILEQVDYPDIKNHKEIHKALLSKALQLKDSYEKREIKASAFFSFVMDDVILDHMLNEDTKFFPFLKKI